MQATAYTYDPETRSGSVLLDDGTPVPFDAPAFDAGGLRMLRPGQRVRIEFAPEAPDAAAASDAAGAAGGDPARRISLVTLHTF